MFDLNKWNENCQHRIMGGILIKKKSSENSSSTCSLDVSEEHEFHFPLVPHISITSVLLFSFSVQISKPRQSKYLVRGVLFCLKLGEIFGGLLSNTPFYSLPVVVVLCI